MADPQGIIAIMTAPDGEVIATHADFYRSTPGGCKLWEGQMWRARDQVKWAAVRAYCSPVIIAAIDNYTCTQIGDALCGKGGHKIAYRAIGYSPEISTDVERNRG